MLNNNPDQCIQCDEDNGYFLFVRSSNRTQCAVARQQTNLTQLPLCDFDYVNYPPDAGLNITGDLDFKFYPMNSGASTTNRFQNYCFSSVIFKLLPSGTSICLQISNSSSVVSQERQQLFKALGGPSNYCQSCTLAQYPTESVVYLSQFNLFLGICNSQADLILPNQSGCNYTSYVKQPTSQCDSCSNKFEHCLSCDSTHCSVCQPNYFYNPQVYDYVTQQYGGKCVVNSCPAGTCMMLDMNLCVSTSLTNCQSCYYQNTVDITESWSVTENEVCIQCDLKYQLIYNLDGSVSCGKMVNSTYNVTYFVTSDESYLNQSGLGNFNTYLQNLKEKTGVFAQSLDQASPLLLYIFPQLSIHANKNMNVTAQIYMTKGQHYMFSCSFLDFSLYNAQVTSNPRLSAYANYCDSAAFYQTQSAQYKLDRNDNYDITIEPLYCSLGPQFGLTNNWKFLQLCVDLAVDPLPLIYVNNPNSFFNISGKLTLRNLQFSGINALFDKPLDGTVQSSFQQRRFYSLLPQKYCTVASIQIGQSQTILQVKSVQPSKWTCSDPYYSGSVTSLDATVANKRCREGTSNQLSSTLSCWGSPQDKDFFTYDDEMVNTGITGPEISSKSHPWRRKTLFNIYSFTDDVSISKATPSLTLNNCTFEHFFGGYESLINIETDNLFKVQKQQPTYGNTDETYSYIDYLAVTGSDKGVKLAIVNSTFRDSRFCKGLIVYKDILSNVPKQDQMLNLTLLRMKQIHPIVDSSILISNSTFTNLNAYINLSALAEQNNQQVVVESLQNYNYSLFIHQGIVMNLQDFNGRVEISNSRFTNNVQFIPEISFKYQPDSHSDPSTFIQTPSNPLVEYQLGACNQTSKTDIRLIENIVSQNQDNEWIFDKFERVGMIYISRNSDKVVIWDNYFASNIGSFGGALTIDSPNWSFGYSPVIVISKNTFKENMAYVSGNAIYIRSRRNVTSDQYCGGVVLDENIFKNNLGLKTSNGGAATFICSNINQSDDQKLSLSSIGGSSIIASQNNQLTFAMKSNSAIKINVKDYSSLNLTNNIFLENYAGVKGSAVYIRDFSKVIINNATFQMNRPFYASAELAYSPYVKSYSNRPITYNDPICTDEFQYLDKCQQNGPSLIWPRVQGALNVEFCTSTDECINSYQSFLISNSTFLNNEAGPMLDNLYKKYNSLSASQIYISGGTNNTIETCSFSNNSGSYFPSLQNFALATLYYPQSYFNSSVSPLINVYVVAPPNTSTASHMFNTTIRRCTFTRNFNVQVILPKYSDNNPTYQGSLVSARNSGGSLQIIKVQDCNVSDNYFQGLHGSSLIYIESALLKMKSNIFKNNGIIQSNVPLFDQYGNLFHSLNQQYGALYLKGFNNLPASMYHEISNNQFQYMFSNQGAAYYVENTQDILLSGNIYQNLFAKDSGAILYVDNGNGTLMIINETASQIYSNNIGSYTLLGSPSFNLYMANCSFNNMQSQTGSAITVQSLGKVYIRNSSFTSNNNSQQNIANQMSQFRQLTIPLSQLINMSIFGSLISNVQLIKGLITITSTQQNNNRSIQFDGVSIFPPSLFQNFSEIINCTVNGVSSKSGAFLYLTDGNIRMESIIVRNSQVLEGGIISIDRNVKMSVNGITIYNCTSKSGALLNVADVNVQMDQISVYNSQVLEGGIISIENNVKMSINGITIQNCTSQKSASGMLIGDNSNVNITNGIFINNTAGTFATILLQQNAQLTCNQCNFTGNNAYDSGTIFAQLNNKVTISGSYFSLNTAGTSLMTLLYSTLSISSTTFLDNTALRVNNGITLVNSIASLTQVKVQNSLNFSAAQVETGFLNLNQLSQIKIINSSFTNISGSGAAVLNAVGGSSVTIYGSIFQGCQSPAGSVILVQTAQLLDITLSQFRSNNAENDIMIMNTPSTISTTIFDSSKGRFIFASGQTLIISTSYFSNGPSIYNEGKALYSKNQIGLTIVASNFWRLSSSRGGAIFIEQTQNLYSYSQAYLFKNTFNSNNANKGGAIYLDNVQNVFLQTNTFIDNSASQDGGAIQFECIRMNCQCQLSRKNFFTQNQATLSGGSISWTDSPISDDGTTVYVDNNATYGASVASYPNRTHVQFSQVNNKNAALKHYQGLFQFIPVLVAGRPFDFLVYVFDYDNNLYTNTNDVSIATLNYNYENVIMANNQAYFNAGIFNFSQVVIRAQPNTSIELSITFIGSLKISTIPQVTVSIGPCTDGESFNQKLMSCQSCSSGQFVAFNETLQQYVCLDCLQNSQCFGGFSVAPISGYWRSSNQSQNFIQCPNTEACLGGSPNNLIGECAEAYQGIACGECKSGYYQSKPFTCQMCPEQSDTINGIVIAVVIAIAIIVVIGRAAIGSDQEFTCYLKMIATHFQILGVIATIGFSWSNEIQSFYQGHTQVSTSNYEPFNVECLSMGYDTPSYFIKLIMYGVLPIFLAIIDLIYWFFHSIFTCNFKGFCRKVVCTFTMLIFLFYPTVTQSILLSLNCVEIDGQMRVREEIGSLCYQDQHLDHIYYVTIPSVILWIIGVPLISLLLLFISLTNQKKLDNDSIDNTNYSFLVSGYNFKHYYWEVIIYMRKLAIICSSVFLSLISSESQAIIMLLIISASISLQLKYQPFQNSTLNQMEYYSLQVAAVTLYIGLFYMTAKNYLANYLVASGIFLACLVASNLAFLGYWAACIRIQLLKSAYTILSKLPTLFKLIACMRRERFFERYIKVKSSKGANNDEQSFEELIVQRKQGWDIKPEAAGIDFTDVVSRKSKKVTKAKIRDGPKDGSNKRNNVEATEIKMFDNLDKDQPEEPGQDISVINDQTNDKLPIIERRHANMSGINEILHDGIEGPNFSSDNDDNEKNDRSNRRLIVEGDSRQQASNNKDELQYASFGRLPQTSHQQRRPGASQQKAWKENVTADALKINNATADAQEIKNAIADAQEIKKATADAQENKNPTADAQENNATNEPPMSQIANEFTGFKIDDSELKGIQQVMDESPVKINLNDNPAIEFNVLLSQAKSEISSKKKKKKKKKKAMAVVVEDEKDALDTIENLHDSLDF